MEAMIFDLMRQSAILSAHPSITSPGNFSSRGGWFWGWRGWRLKHQCEIHTYWADVFMRLLGLEITWK
jgi:hypothetical protein